MEGWKRGGGARSSMRHLSPSDKIAVGGRDNKLKSKGRDVSKVWLFF